MIRYAITDGKVLEYGGSGVLWEQADQWARARLDYVQLREKDVSPAGLAKLARGVLDRLKGSPTRLLINSRADVAAAIGAHGVHLTSAPGELPPAGVRAVYEAASLPAPIITASAHSLAEVERAVHGRVDYILFGPVFGKLVAGEEFGRRLGLDALREACAAAGKTQVLALGNIREDNLQSAMDAGAAGIAAIRYFTNVRSREDHIAPQKPK